MNEYGDIQLNGKWYRIDTASYRDRDVVDFSPRAASPGGGIVLSDLMLYQPLMQSDWRHGFGFIKYEDALGYLKTVGNIDTRHEGVVLMYTDKVSSDTGAFRKKGAMTHKNIPYFWGEDGIRKYSGGAWTTITPNPVTTCVVTNGGFETFASPNFTGWTNAVGDGAIAQTAVAGEFYELTKALKITCGATNNTSIKQTFVVVPGYIYTIKFWSRTDATHGAGNYKVYDETNSADIVALAACSTATPSTDFAETTATFTCPAGCISMSVIFYPNSTNTAINYFDALTMTSTNQPVANTQLMLSLGTDMFAVPYNDRIMRTVYSGEAQEQPAEVRAFDTYINEAATTTNYGKSTELVFGSKVTANKSNHILLKFLLDKIPTGATLTEVKLTMYCKTKSGTVPDITISRLLVSPTELGATWAKYNGSDAWNTAGGTGSATDISATPLCTVASPTVTAKQFYTFTLDVTEFNNFITGTNTGLIIHETTLNPTGLNSATFASSSEANYDWRPYLTFKYTLPEEWVDTGTSETSKDYTWSVTHNGFTYMGVRDSNRIHYSSSATLADIEGTSADPSSVVVGAGSYPTLGAISFMGSLYISRADGLWQLGDDKIARRMLDFSSEVSNDNFNTMTIHNGYLIFPVRDVIYQWNGARLTRITPPRLTDDWPYMTYGGFRNFITIGDFLYCTGRTNETTYTESLLCYDGVGWHKLCDLITDGEGLITLLFFDVSNNYLWIHKDSISQTTYYIPFQERSEFPYSAFPTTGTHSLYSCMHDMGFSRVTKSSPSILIEADNLTQSSYLSVYYAIDGHDFVLWGHIREEGTTELVLPGGLHTQEYRHIQLRVDFTTTVATETPILKGITLRFIMRPDVAYGWNFNILAADHFIYGEREDTRTAATLIKDLKIARNSKAPVKFVDLYGMEYYVYLSSYSNNIQERNVDEENGMIPSLESMININLVEAR